MTPMAGQRSTKENLQQLIMALTADELKGIESLLSAGTDVNARDDRGLTALMHAARSTDNPRIVKRLLAAGADPAATDDDRKGRAVERDEAGGLGRRILARLAYNFGTWKPGDGPDGASTAWACSSSA